MVWQDNEGNLGNVLVQEAGLPVAIDSALFAVRASVGGQPNAALARLRARQRLLVAQLSANQEEIEVEAVAALSARLLQQGLALRAEALRAGLRAGLLRCRALLSRERLRALHREVLLHGAGERDWQNVWEKDAALIDVEFIGEFLDMLQELK